ncbi:hypothetical protein B0H19DRAFT_1224429 [Mycena capillaripes]|nr:hypothetical protein B0H19DRAFT_1224429 [Mycena capillaripes]
MEAVSAGRLSVQGSLILALPFVGVSLGRLSVQGSLILALPFVRASPGRLSVQGSLILVLAPAQPVTFKKPPVKFRFVFSILALFAVINAAVVPIDADCVDCGTNGSFIARPKGIRAADPNPVEVTPDVAGHPKGIRSVEADAPDSCSAC